MAHARGHEAAGAFFLRIPQLRDAAEKVRRVFQEPKLDCVSIQKRLTHVDGNILKTLGIALYHYPFFQLRTAHRSSLGTRPRRIAAAANLGCDGLHKFGIKAGR